MSGTQARMKKLMFAALVGAALMWFFDPANGSQRRDSVQRKLNQGRTAAPTGPVRVADLDTDRMTSAAAR